MEMIYQILSIWIETEETTKIILLMYFLSLIEWEKSNGRFKTNTSRVRIDRG